MFKIIKCTKIEGQETKGNIFKYYYFLLSTFINFTLTLALHPRENLKKTKKHETNGALCLPEQKPNQIPYIPSFIFACNKICENGENG